MTERPKKTKASRSKSSKNGTSRAKKAKPKPAGRKKAEASKNGQRPTKNTRRKSAKHAKPQPSLNGHSLPSPLLNADAFRELARSQLSECLNTGEAVTLAVIDADDFSEVNASMGLERGDLFLKALLERLLKNKDLKEQPIGHLNGDVFALLLKGIEPEDAFRILDKAREAVANTELRSGRGGSLRRHKLTVSIGIAGQPHHGKTYLDVLMRALNATRRAKKLGKDRIAFPSDDNMSTKTSHYSKGQLEALRSLAKTLSRKDSELLREALEDLLLKYKGRNR